MRFVFFFITAMAIAGDFTTSLGDAYPYTVSAITADAAGNTYVVGSRAIPGSSAFRIGTDGLVAPIGPGSDVFVSKLDPNGRVLFTDHFGGKGSDVGIAIALDPSGNIYIAGATTSDDFPLTKALQTQPNTSSGTGFIVKLTNDGGTILYSTFFGGALGATSISSLATDAKGNLYLTGTTTAADFPHTAGMPFGGVQSGSSLAVSGAIVASISAAGDKVLYAGAFAGMTGLVACGAGPSGDDSGGSCLITTYGAAIAVDSAGNAYVAGNSDATDLPSTAGVLSPNGIGAFIAKVNAGGTALGYLTYLGSGFMTARALTAIAVDSTGNAYLAGWTNDPKFPTTPGSLQPVVAGPSDRTDAFFAKLKPDASAMVWATYLGGTGNDSAQSIAVDGSGNVWATGFTALSNFPNAQGWSTGDEFLVELDAAGSKLMYSALYPDGTVAQALALDPSGLVHVAGANGFVSAIAPTAAPTMRIFGFENAANVFITARIAPAEVISIFGPGIGPPAAITATPANGFYPKTLAGVQVTINGVSMPLLYASANQINAIVPMGIAAGAGATVRVISGTTVSPGYPVWILDNEPEAFPAVLNQDGTINSQSNPAQGGSVITFYATGWQSSFSPLTDGQIAAAAQDGCLNLCQAYTDLSDAEVLYGGAAPGIVAGVTQFNIRLGAIDSQSAQQVNLYVYSPAHLIELVWVAP
jgi:uncharacterized protein (TIGR03437 family)